MSAVTWVDPPERLRLARVYDWEGIALELRSRPGSWARVAVNVSTAHTSNINAGKYKAMPAGEFEAVSRSAGLGYDAGHADVYVRYVGRQP